MPVAVVLMLSTGVPPDPVTEEVPALAAQCQAIGRTYLLTTKRVSMSQYQRGRSRVALIVNDGNRLIGHGALRGLHFYDQSPHLGPAIYQQHQPDRPECWLELTDFVAVNPPEDLATLGWEYPHEGPRELLTSARVPQGQGGQYFRAWQP